MNDLENVSAERCDSSEDIVAATRRHSVCLVGDGIHWH